MEEESQGIGHQTASASDTSSGVHLIENNPPDTPLPVHNGPSQVEVEPTDASMQSVLVGETPSITLALSNGSADDLGDPNDNITDFSSLVHSPSDIILDTGDQQFLCHRDVLSQESLWFRAMFESGMKESCSERVHLTETDSKYFQLLLQYFYTGHLKLRQSNVHSLTELCSIYQSNKALKLCCEFLISIIEDDLCLSLMRMANLFMLTDVYNQTRRHALWHFSRVSLVEDFFLAPVAQVVDYLQDPYLNIDSELDVFQAVASWYQAQEKPCELADIEELFASTVNFHLMGDEEIKMMCNLPVLQKDQELVKFAILLGQEDVISRLKSKNTTRTRTTPRDGCILCMGAHQCQLATCGKGCDVSQRNTAPLEVMLFHPDTCTLEQLTSLHDVFHTSLALDCGYRVCAIGHQVYVCGGEASLGRNTWLNTIWCLDTLSGTWSKAGQMQQPRRHHGLCAYKSSLFLVGGIGRYRIRIQTMESFDTVTGEWTKHPDMLHQETAPAVTQHDGCIFVFKNSFQMYNISKQTWSYLQLYPSGSVPGLPIYARSDPEGRSILVSCFNSETLWQVDLQQLKCQRLCDFENEGGGAVFCQGHVFHFQLYDSHGEDTEVECYSLADKQRSRKGALPRAVLTSHFVTIPKFPHFTPSSSNQLG